MTNYELIQKNKVFCASAISSAIYGANYEITDYAPIVMEWLDDPAPKQEDPDEG